MIFFSEVWQEIGAKHLKSALIKINSTYSFSSRNSDNLLKEATDLSQVTWPRWAADWEQGSAWQAPLGCAACPPLTAGAQGRITDHQGIKSKVGRQHKPLQCCVSMDPILYYMEWSWNFPDDSGSPFRKEITEDSKPVPCSSANCFFLVLCCGALTT